ncbi:MAG: GNAT family N-acetyltransferase [Herpetosiphonaceae bacterium]|nr:GNAT family N-acetyltransferase [Herpetosiphonaceae bacterium]
MRYRFVYSIEAIEQDPWNALAGDTLSMTHGWLRLLERAFRNQQPCYIIFEDAAGWAAIVTASTYGHFGRKGWREKLLRRATLVVTAPYSSLHSGIALRSDVTIDQLLPDLQRALASLCWRKQRLIYALSSIDSADVAFWQRHGFSASRQPDYSMLDLGCATYEDYLQRLPGKDRAELRRIRRRGAESGVTFEIGPPRPGEGPEIYPLLCQVHARYGHTLETMPFGPTLLETMSRELGDAVILIRGYVNGVLEGVSICIREGDSLSWPIAGLNYAVSRPTYLYFLLIDEMVRWSIGQGIRRITGGLSNEREKRGHGFHIHERWFCVRMHPSPANTLLVRALPVLRRLIGDPDEETHPVPAAGIESTVIRSK